MSRAGFATPCPLVGTGAAPYRWRRRSLLAGPHSRPLLKVPGTIQIVLRCAGEQVLELSVTRREYYVDRAAECLLASEQIPSDRDVLLHMAATYIKIAIDSELAGASTDIIRDGPLGTSTGNHCCFR
jgi:hypothetical protein